MNARLHLPNPAGLRALLRRPEAPVLFALLALSGLCLGFIHLADEVREGDTQDFDQRVVDWLRNPENPRLPRGPRYLVELGRDISALGGIAVVSLTTIAATGYMLLCGQRRAACLVVLAVVSGVIVSSLLKHWVDRPRPAAGSDLVQVFTSSFPSGHSMLSAVVYLALGTLLAKMEQRRALKIYFITMAILLTALVGASRVYLGVHYPSDVLGGWTAGLAWALAWWFIARWFQRRKMIEPSITTTSGASPGE